MSPIKAVFFDVGATLLMPADSEAGPFTDIANKHGAEVTTDEVLPNIPIMYELYEELYEQDESFWSDDLRAKGIWLKMYTYLCSLSGIPEELRAGIAEDVYQFYFSPRAWTTFDDVPKTLDTLKEQGYRMGLISNWDSHLPSVIEGLGLSSYFETIVSSAGVQLHKPMPEIFHLALDRLGIKPEEAMHVGDHLTADAEGAASVGIRAVLLDRYDHYQDYQGLRVTDLTQILAFLP